MADLTIVTQDAAASSTQGRSSRWLVFTSSSDGYLFYVDVNDDLMYVKTTDGGASWGSAVTVRTGTVSCFGLWYDKWTPTQTGTRIHVVSLDSGTGFGYYRYLDTSGDSLGTEAAVISGGTFNTGRSIHVSVAKMKGGNLLAAYNQTNTGAGGMVRSTDNGLNWGTVTNPYETTTSDLALVFPGNEADTQDGWILFHDSSADELSLKTYDDSANSFSETSIATAVDNTTDGLGQWPMAGAIRHSDGHLICAVSSEYDSATGDTLVYDINGAASIVAKTNIHTNADDMYHLAVMVDQNTDNLYVGHVGKIDGTEALGSNAHAYYAKSVNGGTSWSTGNAYSVDANISRRQLWAPLSGNRLLFAWRDTAATTILTNTANSLDLTPAGGGGSGTGNLLLLGVG